MRVFIAFDLAIKVVEQLVLLQEDLHRPITATGARPRWVEASNIHLTLKFLGELEEPLIRRVRQTLLEVATRHPIFEIDTIGMGCFPNPRRPRIVWAGTGRGCDETVELQEDIETSLHRLGIARDSRSFHPHITIGRVKTFKNRVDLEDTLAPFVETHFGTSVVKDFALFQSTLTPKGAIYQVIERYPLMG